MNTKDLVATLKKPIKKTVLKIRNTKYMNPLGPYKKINREDQEQFSRILSAWQPKDGNPTYLIRWCMTEWCNYTCPYCDQNHGRYTQKEGGYTAHAFDNHQPKKWIDAFQRHFSARRLSLVVTGGEPMLDQKNMAPLLTTLTSMPTVDCIRIDTNSTWKPDSYKDVERSKIILMCTYHPSQIKEERFINRIQEFIDFGFQIGMVNFVMDRNNFGSYQHVKEKLAKLDVPLHPNPLWNSLGQYSDEDLEVLEQKLPNADYRYRTNIESPLGKKCLYPALAYEMNQNGDIHIGCHRGVSGSFFNANLLETFAGPVPCPTRACVCLDKYSFLGDVNRNINTN